MTAPSRTWALYAGGFLGPFGGAIVTTMLPEMQADLGGSMAAVSASLTVYMIPFALLMLISGTLAERIGRRRTVLTAYLVYAAGSVLCALASSLGLLLAARAVQGAANAFTTPVLVAAVAMAVPRERLGRALGLFASLQALGAASAPLIGGAAAAAGWSLAFWGVAGVAVLLAFFPPPDAQHRRDGTGRWRGLLTPQLKLASVVALLAYITSIGATVLVVLRADDTFGLGPAERGLVVACFGLAGLIAGPALGALFDRRGRLVPGAAASAALGLAVCATGLVAGLPLLIAALAVAGGAAAGARGLVNQLAVTSSRHNPAGATSVMLACQFAGGAIAPPLLVPIYEHSGAVALVAAGIPAIVAAGVLLVAAGRVTT